MGKKLMFNKKPYTTQELNTYCKDIETLDRLAEKAKRNYLGGGQKPEDKEIYESYTKTLLIAQTTYQRILTKVAK